LELSAEERRYLERQVRRHRVARSLSERSRIILRCVGDGSIRQVQRWFAELTGKRLRRGDHTSVRQLQADIRAFIDKHNQDPELFMHHLHRSYSPQSSASVNPEAVRANLRFLVDVGLVPSYAESLRSFLDKNPNSALPSSFTAGVSSLQDVHTDDDAIDLVMRLEGGFSDNPLDPGGASNFGITLTALSEYLGKSASKEDVRNLSVETARDIYKKRYLTGVASRISSVQVKAAYLGLATSVGPGQASKFFQVAIGEIDNLPVSADGILGPETVQRINAIDPDLLIETVNCKAARFYESLSMFQKSGPFWMRRLRTFSPVALKGICPELHASSNVGGTTPSKP
jgi:lysozyme family protein